MEIIDILQMVLVPPIVVAWRPVCSRLQESVTPWTINTVLVFYSKHAYIHCTYVVLMLLSLSGIGLAYKHDV